MLPAVYVIGRLWDTLMAIVERIREQAVFEAAPKETIDLASREIRVVNWWTLRKAGFDCEKPRDSHRDPGQRLHGKPCAC